MRIISDHHKKSAAPVTSLDFSSLSPHWLMATADRRASVWSADWVSSAAESSLKFGLTILLGLLETGRVLKI